MKKNVTLGIAVAAVVALLGTPAMATAAPHGQTNGSTLDRFARTNGGDVPNPFGSKTSGDVPNPHGQTNGGDAPTPFGHTD